MSRRRHCLAIVITMCAAGVFGTAVGGAAPAAASGPEEILIGDFSQGLSGWSGYPSLALRDGAGCNSVPAAPEPTVRRPVRPASRSSRGRRTT